LAGAKCLVEEKQVLYQWKNAVVKKKKMIVLFRNGIVFNKFENGKKGSSGTRIKPFQKGWENSVRPLTESGNFGLGV